MFARKGTSPRALSTRQQFELLCTLACGSLSDVRGVPNGDGELAPDEKERVTNPFK